ncbi:MAG: PQQ-binding-like beta-propeller repeat protein [Pirellulales bacterium]|nr:PQQ-binding-like beta-propeller repeat protein [Pirellulales bacterium]
MTNSAFAADNWTSYRGPTDQGHADSANLPLHWNETENVAWKIKLPGKGRSTPVIWGDRLWLTTATPDGKELSALCIDKHSGEILIEKLLHKVEKPQGCHPMNSYATPSPTIEEGRVYVSYGSPYLACLDGQTGEVLWERADIPCRHTVGPASSPMLYKNLLIAHYDGCDEQFVLAVDKRTGETVWKTPRTVEFDDIDPQTNRPKEEGEYRKASSAPIIAEIGGRPVLVSLGSMALYGYDPLTGKELWRLDAIGSYSGVMRPIAENGIIYCHVGSNLELWAIEPGTAEGVLDAKKCILWKYKKTVPFLSSILLVEGRIFMVADNGIAVCLDAKTGKQFWKERLEGDHAASPIDNRGKVYYFGQKGKTMVVEAGPKFQILAENKLDEGMLASPAVSGDALYLRTITSLYCIKNK